MTMSLDNEGGIAKLKALNKAAKLTAVVAEMELPYRVVAKCN